MDTALTWKAGWLAHEGWTITSLTPEAVLATRRKGPNGLLILLGIIGLFFYVIPGLLIFVIAYTARGQESIVVTTAQAQAEQLAAATAHTGKLARARKAGETRRRAWGRISPWLADRTTVVEPALVVLVCLAAVALIIWAMSSL